MRGATTVFNTYWIRFESRGMTFDRAVENIRALIEAARKAGVRRFVQISITNASAASPLPYFRGKGIIEDVLRGSGLSYAIVRPALIFGPKDILVNNIAWAVRRFPMFLTPANGQYRVQPIFVDDLSEFVVDAAEETRNLEFDAVGPEIFMFDELVRLLAETLGKTLRIVHVRPLSALLCAKVLGWLMHDVMLTSDEIRGLRADLLNSHCPPIAPTRLSDWLKRNATEVGLRYASELAKRA